MTDRFLARSSLLALAFASMGALSACESDSNKNPEPLAKTSSAVVLSTGLQPGDIAVTCIDTSSGTQDLLEVTPLVQPSGAVMFTDKEATTAGAFNAGENPSTLVPVATIGVPVLLTGDQNLGNPEQVFLYQGTQLADVDGSVSGGNLLWGVQVGADWLFPGGDAAVTANVSFIPSDLGIYHMSFFETSDAGVTPADAGADGGSDGGVLTARAYMGPTTGTKAALQAAILDKANWPFVAACPNRTLTIVGTDAGTDGPVADGSTNDSSTDVPANGTGGTDGGGAGGATGGTDGGSSATGGTDGGATGGTGAGGSSATGGADGGVDTGAAGSGAVDSGSDVKADTGTDTGTTVDAKADTGTDTGPAVDAKADTGTDVKPDTGTTDAKTDVPKTDAGTDAPKSSGGGGGCSCSTAVGRDGLGASAWMLAIAGILFTARRKNKKRR